MNAKLPSIFLVVLLGVGNTLPVLAGGGLETRDITGNVPSPIAGHILARVIPMRWDSRAIPVKYSMNTSLDPIPNPLGPAFLSVAEAQSALQNSFDAWNSIPTSFIDMRITGTTAKTTLAGFDFVNELTFQTAAAFTALASSPSVTLIRDATFANGDDIDGDGDSDVSNAILVVTDVNGDGDLEFPAGFYKAGTILDNDVQFNTKTTNGVRFTLGQANMDAVTRSVDLNTVATHEFGHSHGLAHSMDNQTSSTDGDGATMFPFIDTGDPVAEAAQAVLGQDDLSWSSYTYPEGSAMSGPAALQPGDTDFDDAYGLITGSLEHGILKQPIAGASVYATRAGKSDVVASGYSGTTRLSQSSTGGLFLLPNVADAVQNGNYVIPIPRGNYNVGIEAVDGNPAAPGNINFTPQIGNFFGQMNLAEEFRNDQSEDKTARVMGQRNDLFVDTGKTVSKVNFYTANSLNISNFGALNAIGFGNVVPGFLYAQRIPASQLAAVNPGEDIGIQGVAFDTIVLDSSVAPTFAQATLTTGSVNPNGSVSVNLNKPLKRVNGFLGQDGDFATFYFDDPYEFGHNLRAEIANGNIDNLFIVLQAPTSGPFPGVSGQAGLIGLSSVAPLFGRSFISTNGGATWILQSGFNFRFSLLLTRPVPD